MKVTQPDAEGHWHRLDNTANIFPVTTTKRFSNVYRIAVTLREEVDPELLQRALEMVLPRFAYMRVQIRHGFFWHYLEDNPNMPQVREEEGYPCGYLDARENRGFMFQVSYYKTRINLEVFHVVTDGTGGYRFLRALCCQYLMLAHPAAFTDEEKTRHWFAGHGTNTEDGYVANYTPTKKATFRLGRGYKLKGQKYLAGPLSVIHAHLKTSAVLDLCHQKGVSVSQYITACIAWAVYTRQLHSRPTKRPVNIMVPVNLRNLFPSNTSLNFFSSFYVSLLFEKPDFTFDDLLAEVKQQYAEKAKKEILQEKISYTVGSGYSPLVRAIPLPIKILMLRIIFASSVKTSTMGTSNTGRIEFPEAFRPHITGTLSMLSTAQGEPFKCAITSYGEVMSLSFTSLLQSVALQQSIIRKFSEDGLDVVVESNGVDYENV